MACRASKDAHGYTYYVPEDRALKDAGGHSVPGAPSPEVQVWWARQFKDRRDETLIIRQDNNAGNRADVIELTLGQVYDLIHALGHAVMRP